MNSGCKSARRTGRKPTKSCFTGSIDGLVPFQGQDTLIAEPCQIRHLAQEFAIKLHMMKTRTSVAIRQAANDIRAAFMSLPGFERIVAAVSALLFARCRLAIRKTCRTAVNVLSATWGYARVYPDLTGLKRCSLSGSYLNLIPENRVGFTKLN